MKRFLIPGLLFLGALFSAPVLAHHAAEGIVSDDIWQMIDDLLEEADSPHLNIDFDNIMDSMAVLPEPNGNGDCQGSADCSGRLYLVTDIVVPDEDVDAYLYYIDMALTETDWNRVPSGSENSGTALALEVEVVDLEDGWTEISLLEPIGTGQPLDNLVPDSNPGSTPGGPNR